MSVGCACGERGLSSGEKGLSVRSTLSVLQISGCLVRGRVGAGGPGPPAPCWSIQYDQTCIGLVLAGPVTTAPRIVLLKNKPVTTDL